MDMHRAHLIIAERHIAEGEKIVAIQCLLIEQMRRQGLDTWTAESTLDIFLSSLKSFYSHREHILRSIEIGQ
jgi:hypothetical protein